MSVHNPPRLAQSAETADLAGLLLALVPVFPPVWQHAFAVDLGFKPRILCTLLGGGGSLGGAPCELIGLGGQVLSAVGMLSLIGAAWAFQRGLQRGGRNLASLGGIALISLMVAGLLDSPGAAFLVLLGAVLLGARIWPPTHAPFVRKPTRGASEAFARGAAVGAGFAWAVGAAAGWAQGLMGLLSLGLSLSFAVGSGFFWAARARAAGDPRWRIPSALLVASVGVAGVLGPVLPGAAATALLVGPLSLLWTTRAGGEAETGFWGALLLHPARSMVSTFIVLCLGGALVLHLPAASAHDEPIAFIDALFTSVSAACVTGLGVKDTPNDFSTFGHLAILGLIQVGGLGIMAFSALTALLLGRRMGLREEAVIGDLLGSAGGVQRALTRLFALTLVTEAVSAALLAACFLYEGDDLGTAVWRGVFTAISAFCNAGFALQSDSLVSYNDNPLILHILALTIIVGGLGPLASLEALPWMRGRRVTLQTKIVLVMSLVLLVAPAVLYLAFEWDDSLAGLGFFDKLHNSWFQSVTLRTAGFNSVDLTLCLTPTVVLMMVLMFIGGSPGSTAGGIKTTTAALLVLAIHAAIQGRTDVRVAGRHLPTVVVFRAIATVTAASLAVVVGLVLLLLNQPLDFRIAAFEVVSASGTVGLSIGGTGQLDDIGKLLIIGLMFAGRVGPLTLFLILQGRRAPAELGYPQEEVAVG